MGSRPIAVIRIFRSLRKGLLEETRLFADFRHKKAFHDADKTRFPFIHSLKEEMFAGDPVSMERFRWGIDVILYGIQKESN